MRAVLYVIALIVGAGMVYRGFMEGLPAPPLSARAAGQLAAFGVGVLMALVGLTFVVRLVTSNDGSSGPSTLLLVVLAAAATAGAVAWKGHSVTKECRAMVTHLRALTLAYDGRAASMERFDAARPDMLQRCEQTPVTQRRCLMRAQSVAEARACE